MINSFKKAVKLFKKSNYIINNFERTISFISRSNELNSLALNSEKSCVEKLAPGENELIVSFTTYNTRIYDVHLVVESIAQQTIRPNRLILWLDEEEFTLESIPLILKNQMGRGLEIRFCPNYRSYKKLVPTLKNFPEANIITIDDDIFYPYDMIELLVKENKLYPDYIISHRAHKMHYDNLNQISRYHEWESETSDSEPSLLIFPIGVGGISYPKGALDSRCLDVKVFMGIAPSADDVWFKAISLSNKIKCKKVKDDRSFWDRFLVIEDSQEDGLYQTNITENDWQIEKPLNILI
ncbi:hypothetical protein Q4498_03955 [Neptunomonas phycophila]|uniref:hypothetical protein n=1 Tax=Neptunomonas phycophila TaxID=1572645 RepID=UPI0026E19978|nr:hypothetical protein [Neptunomonas phycophila]MDO6467261.1 hypothetical protein [Neptunomonas phycophila]